MHIQWSPNSDITMKLTEKVGISRSEWVQNVTDAGWIHNWTGKTQPRQYFGSIITVANKLINWVESPTWNVA